eukprot:scaffold2911_cov414-Prasinococcus_capsulatus_cf.AAC.30
MYLVARWILLVLPPSTTVAPGLTPLPPAGPPAVLVPPSCRSCARLTTAATQGRHPARGRSRSCASRGAPSPASCTETARGARHTCAAFPTS